MGNLILGENIEYSMNSYQTRLNNNVIVVGTSGSGKTRSILTPNLLEKNGSYVISDPKGNLYNKYKNHLEEHGYKVRKLDFTDPLNSAHYNFFNYIRSAQDIKKVAHMITRREKAISNDPFWDDTAQILFEALIEMLIELDNKDEMNMKVICELIRDAFVDENELNSVGKLDDIMKRHNELVKGSEAYKKFIMVRNSASKTYRSIVVSLVSKIALLDSPEIREMMKYDDIDITSIGKERTALFVVVSDTDRSLDPIVNLFFTQAMNELCQYADRYCINSRLPVSVQFIMDDFATNCVIGDFPRMISSIRSRGISTMIMIQAESQLEKYYREDARTIISNCDTYVYLGVNDVETAKSIAERADVPLKNIINMPVGNVIVFRRGEEPVKGVQVDYDRVHIKKGLYIKEYSRVV